MSDSDTRLSKKLSSLLRHNAAKQGIPIRSDGFVKLKDLAKTQQLSKCTLDDYRRIVANDNKQRYTLAEENGEWLIRANQGHSLQVEDLDLTELHTPIVAFHGTNMRSWLTIKQSGGLSKMKRQHIHMATGEPGKAISGIRASANVLIYVDMDQCLKDGIHFYLSANGVVLSPGNDQGMIPLKYISKVTDRLGNAVL